MERWTGDYDQPTMRPLRQPDAGIRRTSLLVPGLLRADEDAGGGCGAGKGGGTAQARGCAERGAMPKIDGEQIRRLLVITVAQDDDSYLSEHDAIDLATKRVSERRDGPWYSMVIFRVHLSRISVEFRNMRDL